MVTGWGRTHEDSFLLHNETMDPTYISNILRRVKIPIVSDAECVQNVFHSSLGIHNFYTLSPKQICAGDIAKIKGPCEVLLQVSIFSVLILLITTKGDSGSPLVVRLLDKLSRQSPVRWSAVGLVSWRNAAGSPGGGCLGATYTVFTEIAEYLDWIAIESGLLPPID